jgi:hypothetical protein
MATIWQQHCGGIGVTHGQPPGTQRHVPDDLPAPRQQHFVPIGRVSAEEAKAKAAQVEYLLLRLGQRLIDLPPVVDVGVGSGLSHPGA